MSHERATIEDPSRKANKFSKVVQNFFFKAAQIIFLSRNCQASLPPKPNRWFNLEMDGSQLFKDDFKPWKSHDIIGLPPLVIETYLDLRALSEDQQLMAEDATSGGRTVIEKAGKKSEIVLERWLFEFDLTTIDPQNSALPVIYKHLIVMFRSLYTLANLLPAYALREKLMSPSLEASCLKVSCRILDGTRPISSRGRIGLSRPLEKVKGPRLANAPVETPELPPHLKQKKFHPVVTNIGSLRASVSYRQNCNFVIDDKEALLSSHFISMDQEQKQVPALRRLSLQSSVSPTTGSPLFRDFSPRRRVSSGKQVQALKTATIGNSPPPTEKSHRSGSNASLVAVLRNPRASFSSGSPVIPIPNPASELIVPKSLSSESLHAEETAVASSNSSSRRFSSSFGSRFNRRGSANSRHNSIESQLATPQQMFLQNQMLWQRSNAEGSPLSFEDSDVEPPSSGLYLADDDISNFVSMLDSKPDLRMASLSSQSSKISKIDSLSKFQQLRDSHQALGESMNASLARRKSASPSSKLLTLEELSPAGRIGHSSASIAQSLAHARARKLSDRSSFSNESHISSRMREVLESKDRDADEHAVADDEEEEVVKRPQNEEEDLLFTMSDMNLRNA